MNLRNIAIIALGVLTLILGMASVYIGVQLLGQEDEESIDTSGGGLSCASVQCADGSEAGPACNYTSGPSCLQRAQTFCTGRGSTVASGTNTNPIPRDQNADCRQDNVDQNLQCTNGAGVGSGCLIFLCPNGCGDDNRCEGDDEGVEIFVEQGSCNATLDGRCGQIDIVSNPTITGDPGYLCIKGEGTGSEQFTCDEPVCNIPDPFCGDGTVDEGEQCDDGNENNNDGCRNDCTIPECGDGRLDSGEECDDGNQNNNDECRNDCTLPEVTCYRCTPRLDDGDTCESQTFQASSCPNGYSTNPDCTIINGGACAVNPFCGDGTIDVGEECDPSNPIDTCGANSICNLSCICESSDCGEPCSSDDVCPDDHTCNVETGTCVLNECLVDGANCSEDLCTVIPELPETSIFDDSTNQLLIGMLLLIGALITTQMNIFQKGALLLNTLQKDSEKLHERQGDESKLEKRVEKSREKFEKKMRKS